MKCKVIAHKLGYKGTTYTEGDTVEMSDTDPCTNVLIRIGRVSPMKAAKKKAKKKASKKTSEKGVIENRAMTSKKSSQPSK